MTSPTPSWSGLPTGRIAVVIPCYRVKEHLLNLLQEIGPEVERIYIIDDACPEGSGRFVQREGRDPRVTVLFHESNQGVGAAVMTGYRSALADGAEVIVKLDGDGQMNPALLLDFVRPIVAGEADYTKGNRFYDLEKLQGMPRIRLFGNAVLSFMAKMSTGYWDLFDPTNGYTAISARVAGHLPFEKISSRYFFETDVLFRLNTDRAVVMDIPMDAVYGDEVSQLKISRVVGEFFLKHLRNTVKRIFYTHYLRGVSVASLELPLGLVLTILGSWFGVIHWWMAARRGVPATPGTVMLSALPIMMGFQFLLAFIGFDMASIPQRPRQRLERLRSPRPIQREMK